MENIKLIPHIPYIIGSIFAKSYDFIVDIPLEVLVF